MKSVQFSMKNKKLQKIKEVSKMITANPEKIASEINAEYVLDNEKKMLQSDLWYYGVQFFDNVWDGGITKYQIKVI